VTTGRLKRIVTVPRAIVVMVVLAIIAGTVVAVNPPPRSHGLAIQAPGSQGSVSHHPWWGSLVRVSTALASRYQAARCRPARSSCSPAAAVREPDLPAL
jgi:hypothetical protein